MINWRKKNRHRHQRYECRSGGGGGGHGEEIVHFIQNFNVKCADAMILKIQSAHIKHVAALANVKFSLIKFYEI